MSRSYGPEEKAKLEKIIKEGGTVLQEIEDLRGSLKDTVKGVADELQIKPAIINNAIKRAFKGDWDAYNADVEEVEAILSITKNL